MKTNIFTPLVNTFGQHLYAPILRLGGNEFALLYRTEVVQPASFGFAVSELLSFGTSTEEAFNIGQMTQEGELPFLEGCEFTGKVFYLLDEANADRRFGFCALPSPQEQRAVMILLSGPLFEESDGAPKPESGEAPKTAITSIPLILRGL
jgi:hypothetical protein